MPAQSPVAIVDIGSNSVRLVVYSGATRAPSILFNEKVMAGLGSDLAETGDLGPESQRRAIDALRRFRLLIGQMGVKTCRVVATAAVREAANGPAFLRSVRNMGFTPEVLSGEDEGVMAGLGVLSAIPDADGIVGDLGGGSLELVDVADGAVRDSVSLPFGVLRVGPLLDKGPGGLARKVQRAVEGTSFARIGARRPFYMVGGSWRAIAHFDMALTDHPLPVTHHHGMTPGRPAELQKALEAIDRGDLKKLPMLSASRIPTMPTANLLLKALVEAIGPSELIVSSYGIREGLLFDALPSRTQAKDPLIEAVRDAGRGLGRFAEHGALIDDWIAPVFDDSPQDARLRLAACLLSDVAWAAHPDFRAERGIDVALHGNWVGIDIPGRVMVAQALFTNFGGGPEFAEYDIAALCRPEALARAAQWGLAMRLANRMSGGVATALERSSLEVEGNILRLQVTRRDAAILGEPVARRLKTLAASLGLGAETVAG